NISEKLHAQEVDDDTVKLFIEALDECEFERYAPGDSAGNMNKTFEAAMKAIEQIETTMKKSKKVKK
ncbi:MAG: protein BatD, partial [Prevotella sp.]|nr:protein BatD [Prevotella sp.]